MRSLIFVLGAGLALGSPASAGVYLLSTLPSYDDPSIVVHPYRYTGMGTALAVRVCVADSPEPFVTSLQQAIALWNSGVTGTPNCTGPCLLFGEPPAPGAYRASAVLLHELGHCALGLDEVNNSNDLDGGYPTNFTNSYNEISINAGADGVEGSSDDQVYPYPGTRDVHWARIGVNDPFDDAPVVIDSTNY